MTTQTPLSISVNFTCKCGNTDATKLIYCKECLGKTALAVLCGVCERRYEIRMESKEIVIDMTVKD